MSRDRCRRRRGRGRTADSILLVAGDKAGCWNDWYHDAILLAEQRYERYLKERADEGEAAMSSHVAWNDIRAEHVARAGGEATVEAGKRQLLAEVVGHRLAEVRRTRGPTQQQVADRMGVSKGSYPRSNAARSPDKTSWPATPPRSAAASTCQLLDAGHSELIGGAA